MGGLMDEQLNVFTNCLLSLILVMTVSATTAKNCKNRLDIVIAVDTTSSNTASNFENVKTALKALVSGFTIGKLHSRLALIGVSNQANVIVNFDGVNSLSDFNLAVDRLIFSSDAVKLSEGMKLATSAVLSKARDQKTVKLLILVKDRRSFCTAAEAAELSRMSSEASGVKSTGASLHAIGVGGLWNRAELESLFGSDYLLFKNKNKALDSIKSLNNQICEAECPRKGSSSEKSGLCYYMMKHIITSKVNLTVNSLGNSVCRTEIDRRFDSCSENQKCNKVQRDIGSCGTDGRTTVLYSMQNFDRKLQSCVTTTKKENVDCADAWKCTDQVADVIFVLDKSFSVGPNFPSIKQATRELILKLNVGPKNVVVGIMKYGSYTEDIVKLGSITNKAELMKVVDGMSTIIKYDTTYTGDALRYARENFMSYGRPEVAKFVILITDGVSTDPSVTMNETQRLKADGVTIYAIGVGNVKLLELEEITAPEASTNMFILDKFEELRSWSQQFSEKLCIQLTAPNPKLCDDNVYMQSVSDCIYGKQQVTRTEYKYNSAMKCVKTYLTTEHQTCRSKCIDPIDGNEYIEGDVWTSLCHEFICTQSNGRSLASRSSKCLAADGTCMAVGSPPFRCRNDLGGEVDTCQCLDINGRPTVVIDTE